jgi:flavin reductase (DIM6/NTAB) family NADH-FMN oxidoreductase RutF
MGCGASFPADCSSVVEPFRRQRRLSFFGKTKLPKEDDVRTIEPKILYFGTPIAIVSSLNEDGTTNLSPISSFWALGWTMTLGVLNDAKMAENLGRHKECVLNLPAPSMWKTVEKLAPLTGKDPVSQEKARQFRTEKDKFAAAGLSRLDSELVRPARVRECPMQMEARVLSMHELGGSKVAELGGGLAAIVEILRVHAAEEFLIEGSDHVDPDKWSPLVYNFRHYYNLSDEELGKTFRA